MVSRKGPGPCYHGGMPISKTVPTILMLAGVLLFACSSAHAQSASAVFAGPQKMDPGLQSGLNTPQGAANDGQRQIPKALFAL